MGRKSWMLPKLIQLISILILLGPIQAEGFPCNKTGICLKCTVNASAHTGRPPDANWDCVDGSDCNSETLFNYTDTDICEDPICHVNTSGPTIERGCGSVPAPPPGTCPQATDGNSMSPPTKSTTPDPDAGGSALEVTFQFFSLIVIFILSHMVTINAVLQKLRVKGDCTSLGRS
ncbi:unnamed protein product [Allacma fusca]|uniref:Sodefrin-like factor n=1 Tax=Allacma fusca TaxID=39272 RepID=A0A8J2L2B8_9HEXA|nr:unnamed protein product [Allacma fusca]